MSFIPPNLPLITDISNKDYHEAEGISASDFSLLEESPLHLHYKSIFKRDSSAFSLGSAVHKLVLESESFKDEFAVEPICDKRTKEGKQLAKEFAENSKNKTILTNESYIQAKEMARNINLIAKNFLQNGEAEKSYFVEDDGIIRKCRPDYFREDLGLLIDIKTTSTKNDYEFSKLIFEYNYHLQSAWYIDTLALFGIEVKQFMFVIIETTTLKPKIRVLDDYSIQIGREKYMRLLDEYKEFLANGIQFNNLVKPISLPEWAKG